MNSSPIIPFFILCASVLAAPAASFAKEDATDPIEQALEALDLDRHDVTPDPYRVLLRSRDSQNLTYYQSLLMRPFEASYSIGMGEEYLLRWTQSPHRLLMNAVGKWDANISRGYIGNPFATVDRGLAASPRPIETAMRMIEGEDAPDGLLDSAQGLDDVPKEWRIEIARLMTAAVWAKHWNERAYRDLGDFDRSAVLHDLLDSQPVDWQNDFRFLVDDLDRAAVAGGGLDVTMLVEDFVDFGRSLESDPEPFLLEIETSLGKVRISTMQSDDVIEGGPYLLSVDWFGDDRYGGAFTEGGPENPASILIDWSGDDLYEGSQDGLAPGSGFFGTGYVHDESGDDTYSGTTLASAGAYFGVSVLVDNAGEDTHTGQNYCQAASAVGVALLLDRSGNDQYTALTASQASGGPLGVAMLLDLSGNDTYTMASEPLLYPSPQRPSVNSSQGQGCGFGLRADLSDGKSVSGGIGILLDREGDDRYTAGVFAQGVGFLGGAGILLDDAGNDVYEGIWYVQAATAHQAFGFLMDRAGDDIYYCEEIIGQGGAHDFSTSVFLDLTGNDSYSVNRLGIGASNENSLGIFIEGGGDDSYEARKQNDAAFGSARVDMWGGPRESALGLGLFFDLGGLDVYKMPRSRKIGNNSTWRNVETHKELELKAELGYGIDCVTNELPVKTGAMTEPGTLETKYYEEAISARREYRRKASQ
ncbi:hypothetical protein KQI84_18745 [bacterium]|nr:hypothetical protein [bacterium]